MSIKEDVEKLNDKVEQTSFAYELLSDYKKQNKRQFIVILIILSMWFITGAYLVWLLNDIGTIEEDNDIIEIQDVETIDNSHIKIGDDIWEKSE